MTKLDKKRKRPLCSGLLIRLIFLEKRMRSCLVYYVYFISQFRAIVHGVVTRNIGIEDGIGI